MSFSHAEIDSADPEGSLLNHDPGYCAHCGRYHDEFSEGAAGMPWWGRLVVIVIPMGLAIAGIQAYRWHRALETANRTIVALQQDLARSKDAAATSSARYVAAMTCADR